MDIYFLTTTNNLVTGYDISVTALIKENKIISSTDHDTIREYVKECDGITEEVKDPSIEYLVAHGQKVKAVMMYYDLHKNEGIDLKQARQAIYEIEKDLE